ncbi:hypothetical protein QFZ20_000125 [Flavobacterium sp. W4I14]|nr:hypothetical protein [Flavobacterium sp. W4I14]
MDDLKRSLEEITLLYKLEPETKDIFVEGISDKLILNRFIKKNKIEDVKVIHVHEIDLDYLKFDNPNIKSNNKAKLLALDKYLEKTFGGNLKGITIIIDRDIDEKLAGIVNGKYLNYTDYHSLELYMYNSHTIDIFYETYLHGFPLTGQRTIESIEPVLLDFYFVKASLYKDGAIEASKFTSYSKSINIDKKKITIDFSASQHILKVLNNLHKAKQYNDYLEYYNNLKAEFHEDPKLVIRGHDYISLLYQLIDKIKNHIGITHDTFEKALFQCIDYSLLKSENLFKSILLKYA